MFSVRSLIGPVQPFHDLFERAVFSRHSIVVGKSNDLSDLKDKIFAKLLCELYGSKGIGTVAVSDELEVFREFLKSWKAMRMARIQGPTPRLSDTW